MPNQAEAQFFKEKYQGFSAHKLSWSIKIGLITTLAAAPFDVLKTRAVMLQEGRVIHGWSAHKGTPMNRIFWEIVDSGAGVRSLWKGLDTIIVKTPIISCFRTYLWSQFYNIFNKDARSKK